MEKIFEKACDQHVMGVMLYGKVSDKVLYVDDAYTKTFQSYLDAISDQYYSDDLALSGRIRIILPGAEVYPIAVYEDGMAALVPPMYTVSHYDSTKTYALNDEVWYGAGKAYKCSTAILVAEEWTASKWTEITDLKTIYWKYEPNT